MEPVDISSGYYRVSELSFYRSVRDAGFQYFADFVPSGRHVIEYELKVSHEGSFYNGPVSLQCMYRPDINAYSYDSGMKLEVVK